MTVHVRSLHKSFGPHEVLKGIDLEIAPGEVVGLIGPNGAGKTTLMSCLLGFLHPDDGEITIDGRANAGSAAYRAARRACMVRVVGNLSRRCVSST